MAAPPLHELLDLPIHTKSEVIEQSYRRIRMVWHPDRCLESNAVSRFQDLQEAYRLWVAGGRKAWHGSAHTPVEAPVSAPVAPWSSKFGTWWRQQWRQHEHSLGDDARIVIHLPLADALHTVTRQVVYRRAQTCPACKGASQACRLCHGTGQRFQWTEGTIKIPAGHPPSRLLRIRGAGHDGPRFDRPGDVFIQIVWCKHHGWEWGGQGPEWRSPRPLWPKRPLPLHLPCGAKIKLELPADLPTNMRIRIKGGGWVLPDGTRLPAWVLGPDARGSAVSD